MVDSGKLPRNGELIRGEGVGGKRKLTNSFNHQTKDPTMCARKASIETPEQVVEHLRSLIAEAEKTLGSNLAEGSAEKLGALRERLAEVREKVDEGLTVARDKICAGARQTDVTIRSHPYESLAIALGVGVLLGAVLRRNS